MQNLLTALKTMKEYSLVHRDIKHLNFLYNMERKKGIMIDFGAVELYLS